MNKVMKLFVAAGVTVGAGIVVKRLLSGNEGEVVTTVDGMQVLRTPEERFAHLEDFPFTPNYVEIDGLRLHYVDEGPRDGEVVLMLHGEPTWSYLYRKMIPIFVEAGYRAIAPDLIGFGKSDKLAATTDYTYARHVDWVWEFVEQLSLNEMTLICQDWGSLIGLRLVGEHPERFARVVAANAALPTGDAPLNKAFQAWLQFSQRAPVLPIGRIVQQGTVHALTKAEVAAYDAPFPNAAYKAGARIFPALVPITSDDPASAANRQAWDSLSQFEKPFLTAFGAKDPILGRGDTLFQRRIPGAIGQPHRRFAEGGHFVQDDCGEELAHLTVDFMKANPIS